MKYDARLFLYGGLSVPAAISLLTMQVYIPAFLAEAGLLSLTAIGLVFFAARIVDTVSDPMIGYLSDRTPTRLGKRRFWIVTGTPLFLIVFFSFQVPHDSSLVLFAQAALWYLFGTCILVPYYAWGAEIEESYEAHNRYTMVRATFGLFGTIVALALPSLFMPGAGSTEVLSFNIMLAAGTFVIALLFLAKLPDRSPRVSGALSLLVAFNLFRRKSRFNKLIISQFVNGTANALPATLYVLFATHILMRTDLIGPLLILYFVSAMIAVPVWAKLSLRWGKEDCWRVAMITASLVFLCTLFVDSETIWLFVLITFVTGLMAGADFSLPASMLADLIDLDEHENKIRRPGVYFAIWGTTSKLTLAAAIGIAFPLLDFGASSSAVSETAINEGWLLVLYAVLPASLKLISVWSLRGYRLDAAAHRRIVSENHSQLRAESD